MALADLSPSLPAPDLAKKLGPAGIRTLLNLMCEAYLDLLESGLVKNNASEGFITEEWFIKIILRWKNSPTIALIPIHQKEDPTKGKKGKRSPTIDFCFRHVFFKESYFGAECKLLDERNREHLSRYMSNDKGIGRFLDGRYASNSSAGAMVGYVRVGDPKVVARDVAECVSTMMDNPAMKKAEPLEKFEDIYESHHNRSYGFSPFQIFHLFFPFNSAA